MGAAVSGQHPAAFLKLDSAGDQFAPAITGGDRRIELAIGVGGRFDDGHVGLLGPGVIFDMFNS